VLWMAGSLDEASDGELVAGEPLEIDGGPGLVGARLSVESPAGAQREIEFRAADGGSLAVAADTGEVGFYRWSHPGRAGVAAVNVPSAESDLVQLSADQIEERLRPVRAELVEVRPTGTAGDPGRLGVRSLTEPILIALLALLVLETIMAGPRFSLRAGR
jgi:hypothetical protein